MPPYCPSPTLLDTPSYKFYGRIRIDIGNQFWARELFIVVGRFFWQLELCLLRSPSHRNMLCFAVSHVHECVRRTLAKCHTPFTPTIISMVAFHRQWSTKMALRCIRGVSLSLNFGSQTFSVNIGCRNRGTALTIHFSPIKCRTNIGVGLLTHGYRRSRQLTLQWLVQTR